MQVRIRGLHNGRRAAAARELPEPQSLPVADAWSSSRKTASRERQVKFCRSIMPKNLKRVRGRCARNLFAAPRNRPIVITTRTQIAGQCQARRKESTQGHCHRQPSFDRRAFELWGAGIKPRRAQRQMPTS